MILLILSFIGLSMFASTYFGKQTGTDIADNPLHGNATFNRENVNSSMKICDWNITGLNIQDMVLFSALAYRYIFIFILLYDYDLL